MFEQLKRAAGSSILETHPHYRTAIGVLGVALPVLLMLASVAGFLETRDFQNSISAYYWADRCKDCHRYVTRDWFVGILFVIGVFLFFYQYSPRHGGIKADTKFTAVRKGWADAWLGKIAGVSAVLVAVLPTAPPESTSQPAVIGYLHGTAAGALFICLSLFPLLLFSQSKKRGPVYRWYGRAMIVALLLVAAHQLLPESVRTTVAPLKPVLFLETFLIFVFGKSWFDKGRELAKPETNTETVKAEILAPS